MAHQVWRHGRFGGPAAEDAGKRECPAEEAAGRGDARERDHSRGAEKKVVTAPARREVVRTMTASGMSERHALRVVGMSA